jgi:hypothetical protein
LARFLADIFPLETADYLMLHKPSGDGYSLLCSKKQHPPSPTSQSIAGFSWRVFHVVKQNPPRKDASATRHGKSPLLGERAG